MKLFSHACLIALLWIIIFGFCPNLWAETHSKDECKTATTSAPLDPSLMSQAAKVTQSLKDKESLPNTWLPHADAIVQIDEKKLEDCYEPQKSTPDGEGHFGKVYRRKRKDEKNCLMFPETVAVKKGKVRHRECVVLEMLKRGRCFKDEKGYVAVMNDYGETFNYESPTAIRTISEVCHLSVSATRIKARQKLKEEFITLIQAGISHRDIGPNNVLVKTVPDHDDFMITLVDFGKSSVEKAKLPTEEDAGNPWSKQWFDLLLMCFALGEETLSEVKEGKKFDFLKVRNDCRKKVKEFEKKHNLNPSGKKRSDEELTEEQKADLIELVRSF